MKVILKKRVDNAVYMDMDHDILDINKLSKAITRCYLPRWSPSPLQTSLLKKLGTVKPMFLYLLVECEERSKAVKTVRLTLDIQDDVDRWAEQVGIVNVDWGSVMECVKEYFQSIGYKGIVCSGDRDVAAFVERLAQDVPLVTEYFETIYHYPEEIARNGFFGEHDEYEAYIKTDTS